MIHKKQCSLIVLVYLVNYILFSYQQSQSGYQRLVAFTTSFSAQSDFAL